MIPTFVAIRNRLLLFRNSVTSCVYANILPSLVSYDQHHTISVYNSRTLAILSYPGKGCKLSVECKNEADPQIISSATPTNLGDAAHQKTVIKPGIDVGSFYLENLFSFNAREWYELLTNVDDKKTVLCLLTNFQRHIRHLRCRELVRIIERCSKLEIRENSEHIDVYYVLLCEILYNTLYRNDRILSINEIARVCKIVTRIKFNKEFDFRSTVPICSSNFEFANNSSSCENCKSRYRELLNFSGGDLVTLLTVILGRSVLKQSTALGNKHENVLVPYLVLVGSRNCTLAAHTVHQMCVDYGKQFMSTRSIRNIGILLHTIKRTKARATPFARRIVDRLSGEGVVEGLLDRELSTRAKLVAISQIIQFCINTHYTPSEFNRKLDRLVCRAVKYAQSLFEAGGVGDIEQYPNFISQLNLLNKSAELERRALNRLLVEEGLKEFIARLELVRPTFSPNDHNTSNTHEQVDSVLKSFNYETKLEHFINPYLVDIFIPSNNAVVEVDGPYHYATGINERVNAILKRPVDGFPLQYSLNSRLKRRLLSKSGYKFINVPYHQWPQTTNEQIYFISNLKI